MIWKVAKKLGPDLAKENEVGRNWYFFGGGGGGGNLVKQRGLSFHSPRPVFVGGGGGRGHLQEETAVPGGAMGGANHRQGLGGVLPSQ